MVAPALCRRRCACGSNRRQQRQHPWWRALAAKEPGTHTPNCPAAEDPKTVLPRDDPYTWPHFGGAFPVGTIPRALNCPAAEAPLPPIPDIPFIFWPRFGGAFLSGTNPRVANCFVAEDHLPRTRELWPRFGGAFSCPHIGNQRPRSRICFGAEDEELSASKHRISAPPPTQAGLFLDAPHTGGAFSRPQPDRSVVSSPNVPHQSLDRYRYPPRALRRYSVPDARKGFAYLCRRPFRPGVPTLSPHP